jgi:hypothetical protein
MQTIFYYFAELINFDLANISNFAKNNGMSINVKITSILLLCQPNDLSKIQLNNLPKIMINDADIPFSNVVRNLGIYIDPTLSWEHHVINMSSRIMGNIYSLNRHSKFIPMAL